MDFKKGLSLVELIAVLAITAIVTAVAMTSFSALIGNKLESDARKMIGDLCWARQMAVARHENYIVDFDVVNEMYAIYRGSVGIDNRIKFQNLAVNLVSVVPPPAQLTFSFPQGAAQSKEINLSYQGRTRQVVVFGNTGFAKIQ